MKMGDASFPIKILAAAAIGSSAISAIVATVLMVMKDPEVARLEMDHEACVTQCVTILRDKQVFPDFQQMVNECSRKFGAGCFLVSEKLNEKK
jgi:hypothetical protein